MKLTYDPKHNIAYLRLHEKKAEVETICVSDELDMDIAPDGTVYGALSAFALRLGGFGGHVRVFGRLVTACYKPLDVCP